MMITTFWLLMILKEIVRFFKTISQAQSIFFVEMMLNRHIHLRKGKKMCHSITNWKFITVIFYYFFLISWLSFFPECVLTLFSVNRYYLTYILNCTLMYRNSLDFSIFLTNYHKHFLISWNRLVFYLGLEGTD